MQNETTWFFQAPGILDQKNARKKTHLEHDLEHKKSHAKRPIDLEHKQLHAKRTDLGHDLKHKKLDNHGKKHFFCKNQLCSVQFWWEFKIMGNMHDQFFKLSINCQLWLQWARWPGGVMFLEGVPQTKPLYRLLQVLG